MCVILFLHKIITVIVNNFNNHWNISPSCDSSRISMFWRLIVACAGASQVALVVKKKPSCQCRRCKRHRFNTWVRKIPWRMAWKHTPVFLPEESHGQRSLAATVHGVTEPDTTEVTACIHRQSSQNSVWYKHCLMLAFMK